MRVGTESGGTWQGERCHNALVLLVRSLLLVCTMNNHPGKVDVVSSCWIPIAAPLFLRLRDCWSQKEGRTESEGLVDHVRLRLQRRRSRRSDGGHPGSISQTQAPVQCTSPQSACWRDTSLLARDARLDPAAHAAICRLHFPKLSKIDSKDMDMDRGYVHTVDGSTKPSSLRSNCGAGLGDNLARMMPFQGIRVR